MHVNDTYYMCDADVQCFQSSSYDLFDCVEVIGYYTL